MPIDRSAEPSNQLLVNSPEKSQPANQKRVLIVQYMGDYREAVERFDRGGEETYYAQRYSVNTVAEAGRRVQEMSILVCITDQPYNQILSNGVRGIGAGLSQNFAAPDLIPLVEQQNPTHLILTFPYQPLLKWAARHQIPTLAVLADSFEGKGLKARIRNSRLAQALNSKQVEWVGNHNLNASRGLQKIGVKPNKIVPWDWAPAVTPRDFATKQLEVDRQPFNLFFAGSVSDSKGVGDLLEAVAQLKSRGLDVALKIAGKGNIQTFTDQAQTLEIASQVSFLGLVSHNRVIQLMREADVVVIPSRHDYAEGLPMTIYEALSVRTPIVASDHPMFAGKLVNELSALVFPAQNSQTFADQIERLLKDPSLYHQLSQNSASAWERLQVPVKFSNLINRWLFDSEENSAYLSYYSLAGGTYDPIE